MNGIPATAESTRRAPRGRVRNHRLRVLIRRLVVLVLVVALWEALARANLLPAAFVGEPTQIVPLLLAQVLNGAIPRALTETMTATLAAFALGGVMALLTALLLTVSPQTKEVLDPYIDALNALPRVALIPLFIVWFGLGLLSKIVSGVSLMYFILLYNTMAGAQSVDPDHILLARSLGLPQRKIFLSIVVPTAVPSIFAGLRLGLIYTLLGVVTAELIAGGTGLGSLISYYSNTFNANGVFAVLLVLVLLSDVLVGAMSRLEHRLTRWKG